MGKNILAIRLSTAAVEPGNTVIVIEHTLQVIKTADRIIDLGPKGGGRLVAAGTPEEMAAAPESFTGQYLAPYLAKAKMRRRA